MTHEQIFERVKEIVVDKLGVEESKVTESAHFANDLGADSLDTVDLILAFEKEFGIKGSEEKFQNGAGTVGDLVSLIEESMKESK